MYDGIIVPKMSFAFLDFMTQAQLKTTAISPRKIGNRRSECIKVQSQGKIMIGKNTKTA